MRVLILSAYNTASHKAWQEGLTALFPEWDWTILSLPGRYFSWRIRGNPLSWAFGKDRPQLDAQYDVILATSMVDLATLQGMVPNIAQTPCILYFHENQFAYPKSQRQHTSIEPQMVNLYAALSAQSLVFNSRYNRDSFLLGVEALLNKMPDEVPNGLTEILKNKSRVLPVGIDTSFFDEAIHSINNAPSRATRSWSTQPLKLVWNHRWEYDKGPEILAEVIQQIDQRSLPIAVSILGQRFRQIPDSLKAIIHSPPPCLVRSEPLDSRHAYQDYLKQQDVVLSTAIHEFQGLAMLEATAAGCIPLAPTRLAYPEVLSPAFLYPSDDGHVANEAHSIIARLQHWIECGLPDHCDVHSYQWSALKPAYQELFESYLS